MYLQGRNRDTEVEDKLAQEGKEMGTHIESSIDTYTLPRVKQIAGGKLPCSTGSSALCDDLGVDGVGGRLKRKRVCVYLQLIHFLYCRN